MSQSRRCDNPAHGAENQTYSRQRPLVYTGGRFRYVRDMAEPKTIRDLEKLLERTEGQEGQYERRKEIRAQIERLKREAE